MTKWTRFVSPWSVVVLAAWIVIMVAVANWAVPVFANVEGYGLECTLNACPRTVTTVEWVPIVLSGAAAATLVVGTGWALRTRLCRDPVNHG